MTLTRKIQVAVFGRFFSAVRPTDRPSKSGSYIQRKQHGQQYWNTNPERGHPPTFLVSKCRVFNPFVFVVYGWFTGCNMFSLLTQVGYQLEPNHTMRWSNMMSSTNRKEMETWLFCWCPAWDGENVTLQKTVVDLELSRNQEHKHHRPCSWTGAQEGWPSDRYGGRHLGELLKSTKRWREWGNWGGGNRLWTWSLEVYLYVILYPSEILKLFLGFCY